MKKRYRLFRLALLICVVMFTGCSMEWIQTVFDQKSENEIITLDNIPEYSGSAYIAIEDNIPVFDKTDKTTSSFEEYSELDVLGRCGTAFANIGTDLMPTEKRGSIGRVKPSGWKTVKYDNVDGKYLYNRCHLIGYQLTAENANEQNLITGTRYLNIEGMLPFENMVADYIKETGNHVLYRVTPIFESENLVADGVNMEGYSVEDYGEGICFNVYAYNVQPGINIDYATGESCLLDY
jgi:DNA-entry nuclease